MGSLCSGPQSSEAVAGSKRPPAPCAGSLEPGSEQFRSFRKMRKALRQTLRDNSLTLMLLLLFGLSLVGMVIAGRAAFNEELSSHGLAPVG